MEELYHTITGAIQNLITHRLFVLQSFLAKNCLIKLDNDELGYRLISHHKDFILIAKISRYPHSSAATIKTCSNF